MAYGCGIRYKYGMFKQQIKDGNTTATIFYLKTKGKSRGYIETQEVIANGINFVLDQDGMEAAKELEGK